MTRIKICGIKEVAHALAVARAGADFIGLVFAPGRRQVSLEQSQDIVYAMKNITPCPAIVGVFANVDIMEVNRVAKECHLDYVQLSGNESPSYCCQMEFPVIKVIHVGEGTTADDILHNINTVSKFCQNKEIVYLLDTYDSQKFGGTGRTFNWRIVKEVSDNFPIMVGGGLNTENVVELIKVAKPWGADVSSGVETNGVKDIIKIESFIQMVRQADGIIKVGEQKQ